MSYIKINTQLSIIVKRTRFKVYITSNQLLLLKAKLTCPFIAINVIKLNIKERIKKQIKKSHILNRK